MDRTWPTDAIKTVVLERYREGYEPLIANLQAMGIDRNAMSAVVNSRASKVHEELSAELPTRDPQFRTRLAVILRYCHAVTSLEYRHRVWPYNLIDLARRVGELWEAMCVLAWESSTDADLQIIDTPPEFKDVRTLFLSDLWEMAEEHPNVADIVEFVDDFTERMDGISMKSDKLFLRAGVPHVIDFKFRFKSNEKGNRNRLSEVAWAYRKWDERSVMMIAVCQTDNNAYLDSLGKDGGWEIITGRGTYHRIGALTGVDILGLLDDVVDFRNDLTQEFVAYTDAHDDDMSCYLDWQEVRRA
jgi:hypothetical protein